MQIDRTTHKLRVIIMGHISLIGLSTPETRFIEAEQEEESGNLVLKLLCSMQPLPQENNDQGDVVTSMGEFRYTPEPIPMNMLGSGVEAAYKWNSVVNKAGVVCWSEISMADGEGAGIVEEFTKFWGLTNEQ